tara:strand:- start:124542 stop:126554 length:2013 start_codon:yes stop_codon:yes gene_type:complete
VWAGRRTAPLPITLILRVLLVPALLWVTGCSRSLRPRWLRLPTSAAVENIDPHDEASNAETEADEDESRYRLAGFRRPAATESTAATESIVDGWLDPTTDVAAPSGRMAADDDSGDRAPAAHLLEDDRSPTGLVPRDASQVPDHFRLLGESEMLQLAFAHSPVLRPLGLRILESPSAATTVYDTAIAATDPFFGPQAALADFDSQLGASINAQNNDRVFNNATLGGQVQELTQDLVSADATWRRRTHSGAIWDIRALTGYDDNNRAGNSFANYWEKQIEAGVRQPLMRGAGREFNLIAGPNAQPGFNFSNGIVIARLNTQISDADFEIAVRTFVRDLYATYWELSRQYQVYDDVVRARDLAHDTWQSVLAKSEAKLAGGESHREAQSRAKFHRYRRDVAIALGGEHEGGGLYGTERRLRQLIGLDVVDGQLLRPADAPVEAKISFDFDALVARSMMNRAELKRQSLRLRQQQLRVVAAKNFLLPQLDLIGRYRLRGFGDDLTGGAGRFSNAYRDFFSLDHQEWEFGLEMGVAVGQRQARAAVRNASLQLQREQAILSEQQRIVRYEISDAIADVNSSYLAMQASQAQVDACRERLESSRALFDADKIPTELLLDAQEESLVAQRQFAADQSRYAVAIINAVDASGSLLTDIGVHLSHDGCRSHILYATEH